MRILVVDDEPGVRHLIDRALARNGHHVVAAPNAGEATGLVLDACHPFDAAVLDIALPGMNGLAFGDFLQTLCPQIRLIFISRLRSLDVVVRPVGSALLEKPFEIAELLAELESLARA